MAWARFFASGVDHCLSSLRLDTVMDKLLREVVPNTVRGMHLTGGAVSPRRAVLRGNDFITIWPDWLLRTADYFMVKSTPLSMVEREGDS